MRKQRITSYLVIFVFIIILWELLSISLSLPFIPSPVIVISNIVSTFISGISAHALTSLLRVLAGIATSLLIGMPIGLCMGYFKGAEKYLSPLVYLTYPIPKIALLPLVMLIFGLGEASKILMIFMIIVFQIIVAARDAVLGIPKETFYSLISLGAGASAIFKKIVLPASLPGVITSVRISMGTALSVLFFTETFGTELGMGYYIMDAWMRVDYVDMFSGIAVLSILGLLLFLAIDIFEKILCRWRKAANQ